MKLKYKIVCIFILSIFISVLVFSFTTYGLLNKGFLSGITTQEMNHVLEPIGEKISSKSNWNDTEIKDLLFAEENMHKKMTFEVLKENGQVITLSEKPMITSMEQLISLLSSHGDYNVDTWVSSMPVTLNGERAYLINSANKADFKVITYYFNGPKANGVLGKITLLGLGITLCIVCVFAYLFTKNIAGRVKSFYDALGDFELGNLSIRLRDDQKDELGELATDFNNMAQKIEDQVNRQEAYEKNRRELISNISHDLRTPLSSVLGYSELLKDGLCEDVEERQKYLELIHRKAVYMEKLLTELLEFSRLECGKLSLKKEKNDMTEFVRELIIEYIPILEQKQIELIADVEEQSIKLLFDKNRMGRVLRNLIDNALKYGMDDKQLRVAVHQVGNQVKLEIQDYGKGMSEETRTRLFERFYRGEKGRNTKSGGMGLGLSIAEEIVRKHGGKMEVISEIDQGTNMVVWLPVE